MTPETKKTLKAIALTAGIILVVGGIGLLIYLNWKKNKEDDEDSDAETQKNSAGKTTTIVKVVPSNYSVSEIKKMQNYLYLRATMMPNSYIIKRLTDTGGIDGKMGDGFNDALKEAIRVNIVKDLNDLLTKATRNSIS
ncbi:MAG: hypothetical protein A3D31_11300 [Candidatus Fluviicola riflensis]|nr:MAG: hypothetical protein CHH17_15725 [Candidatus Fluviicola riflensis]OGS77575.1 MAG: hypothetical protein A3D31_11300 [Candidatus Fluviicola riflensis]OGS84156.1 MAG: hypothetical protein A3E30_12700 [Fluviicola sp. RIFCSPHIGHO2_12_FULL_43_24]OGS84641.1 MAG: hypothetical protein A2724_08235 [Fluviicola sp. RIFCSPHIGHO2_01_FULL_43_53]